METTGERIKRLRTAAGLSQVQLAERSGVPQGAISHYEADDYEPSLSSVRKLAPALGVEVGYLVNGGRLASGQRAEG